MKNKFLALYIFLFGAISTNISAQSDGQSKYNYRYPLNIPPVLSANFGELRANHFHSGIDLKTQGVINKPVYSIEDGYVSRISVSPWGYGLALYISHPSGHTSVYGHLESYAPKTNKYLKEKQYKTESYNIDITVEKDQIPVKRGEVVAYSGNTGSSFGPHVHFEIRETKSDLVLDPLPFYKSQLTDTQKPQIRGIAVYPIAEKGVVNNSPLVSRHTITTGKDGSLSPIKTTINAWGRIGLGIYAVDRMTGTSNVYGVKKVELWCNNEKVFTYNISSLSFDQSRMINSLTDFDYWQRKKIFYMRAFIEPGNKLPMFEATNNGYIDINEERTYNLQYRLEDLYGNKSTYTLNINGKKQDIPTPNLNAQYMKWTEDNYYISNDFSLTLPKDNMYDDIRFNLFKEESNIYFSDKQTINDYYVPLHNGATVSIKLNNDTLINKGQYGVVQLKSDKETWLGGVYKEGVMDLNIRELGNTYAITSDKEAPIITPIGSEKWVANKKIRIKATDNLSGVKTYRGTIDGKYVLFQYDNKSPIYTYTFDDERLEKGKKHVLEFVVTDSASNSKSYTHEFYY